MFWHSRWRANSTRLTPCPLPSGRLCWSRNSRASPRAHSFNKYRTVFSGHVQRNEGLQQSRSNAIWTFPLVAADETYVSGKFDKRRARVRWNKAPAVHNIERETGKVHLKHLSSANRWNIAKEIDAVVMPAVARSVAGVRDFV